jgi:FkbM family methyltransferase
VKKVFLDCGGNVGQSIRKFKASKKYSKDFIIHSFEPVESFYKFYKDWPGVNFHNEAVWIYDGEIKFFVDFGKRVPYGSTLFKEKKSRTLDRENPITVPCIDFGKWVKENFNKDDFIILKMDIEGAEYEVLKKMVEDGSIHYIDEMYIEWHYHKIGLPEKTHLDILELLSSVKTLKILPEMGKVL